MGNRPSSNMFLSITGGLRTTLLCALLSTGVAFVATPSAIAKSNEYECDFKITKLQSPTLEGFNLSIILNGKENALIDVEYEASLATLSKAFQEKLIEGNKAKRAHLIKLLALQFAAQLRKELDDKNSELYKIKDVKIDEIRTAFPQLFEILYDDKKVYDLFDVKNVKITGDILKIAISLDIGEPFNLYAGTAFQINNNKLKVTSIFLEVDDANDFLFVVPVEDFPVFPTEVSDQGFSAAIRKKKGESSMKMTLDYQKSRNSIELKIKGPNDMDIQANGKCG